MEAPLDVSKEIPSSWKLKHFLQKHGHTQAYSLLKIWTVGRARMRLHNKK